MFLKIKVGLLKVVEVSIGRTVLENKLIVVVKLTIEVENLSSLRAKSNIGSYLLILNKEVYKLLFVTLL